MTKMKRIGYALLFSSAIYCLLFAMLTKLGDYYYKGTDTMYVIQFFSVVFISILAIREAFKIGKGTSRLINAIDTIFFQRWK